ncbi:hypothetical protein [Bacillus wiedmannii]|uniref:hypothetical protein n=1 Tax=Bacillus wiedmannii TaxID=1890302 RepID=UPI000BF4F76F|nr:hypothetical protein [Bacillus wiedmannii]PGD94983.1 hypothetical protein COM48_14635 [Bacillus wiedmannii]
MMKKPKANRNLKARIVANEKNVTVSVEGNSLEQYIEVQRKERKKERAQRRNRTARFKEKLEILVNN